MKCPKCGKEIANDSNFCEYCGIRIKSNSMSPWVKFVMILTVFIMCAVAVEVAVTEFSNPTYSDDTEPYDEYITDSNSVAEEDAEEVTEETADTAVASSLCKNYLYTNDNNLIFDYQGGYDNRKTIYINSNESWNISTGTASWAHCKKDDDYVIIWCDYNPCEERDDYIILTSTSGLTCRIDFHQN